MLFRFITESPIKCLQIEGSTSKRKCSLFSYFTFSMKLITLALRSLHKEAI